MSKIRRGLSFALVFVMLVSLFAVMPASNIQAEAADASKTVSAWHTSMLDLNGEKASTALAVIQAMPNTSTYRSRLQMNAAGDSFRVTLTNYYGGEDLKVTHMTVARPGGTGNATSIDTATLKTVTVKGSQTFTIPRGGSVTTDWIDYNFIAGETLTFSTCLSNSKQVRDSGLTGGSSWLFWSDYSMEQDSTGLFHLQKEDKNVGNYDLVPLITNVEANCTAADPYTVVVIGDSTVTNSVPALLQSNLRSNGVRNVSVVSSAIKGNELLADGVGENGPLEGNALVSRFGLDATGLANVKKIFVKVGVNDIIHPNCSNIAKYYDGTPSAQEIINGYKQLINAAHAKSIEIYFFDIAPWIGYTREDTVTTNETTIAQMESVRLEVNAWLAANCSMDENCRDKAPEAGSMSFGYIPVSEAIGTERAGFAGQYVLADEYTTDHIHYTAEGQRAVANLIPISIFKDIADVESVGSAAVKNLWVTSTTIAQNAKYLFASTPGDIDANDQQTAAVLLAADPDQDGDSPKGGDNVFSVETQHSCLEIPAVIQRGTQGAPYIAVTSADALSARYEAAMWSTNNVQQARLMWTNQTGQTLAFYYVATLGTTVLKLNEFSIGFVVGSTIPATSGTGTKWFSFNSSFSGASTPGLDPYTTYLQYGGIAGGNKYLTWSTDPDKDADGPTAGGIDDLTCWRAVNSEGNNNSGYKYGKGVTLLSKLDTMNTSMTAADSKSVHYAAPAGTAVDFDLTLSDNLYNRNSTELNETVVNTADINAGNIPFVGYTYGENRSVSYSVKSDDSNVVAVENGKLVLTGEAGTAIVTLTFKWTELDGTQYEMSADAAVTNVKYDCDIVIDGETPDEYEVLNYSGDTVKDVSVYWTSVPVSELPEGGHWAWNSSDNSIFTVSGSGEDAEVSFTDKNGSADLTVSYVGEDGTVYCTDTVKLTNVVYGIDIRIGDDASDPYLDSRTYIGAAAGEEVELTAVGIGAAALPEGGTYTWELDARDGASAEADGSKAVVSFSGEDGVVYAAVTYTLEDGTEFESSVVVFATAGVASTNTVIDFGLPVQVDLNALSGSKASGISAAEPNTALNTGKSAADEFNASKTAQLSFGDASLADDGVMTYTPNKMASDKDTVFYSAKADGGFKYSNVDIIPASNVYYEDSFVSFDNNWVNDGDAMLRYQSADRHSPYGNDEAYGDYTTYSMGSAMKASVAAGDGKTCTASFTFTGTGFELYSVTNAESGGAIVRYTNSDGTVKKANLINNNSADSFYQLPCFKAVGLDYDTYTVTVTVAYSTLFDTVVTPASEVNGVYTPAVYKGGYSFWIDGVRVYNCAGDAFNDIYAADNEANAQYISIRDQLISKAQAEGSDTIEGAVFVDSSNAGGQTVTSIADYKNFGPKNEVYLAKGQSVAFVINGAAEAADIQIGAKLAGAEGTGILNINGEKIAELNSATNMYYGIKSACGDNCIVITNTGDAVISLTCVKLTYGEAAAPAMLMFSMDMLPDVIDTVNALVAPEDDADEPVVTPDPEPSDDPDDIDDGDNGDDGSSGSDDSIISIIQRALKLIKSFFGNLIGGKK